MTDDGSRALPRLLADSGYRSATRTQEWTEVLIWRDSERWLGRGPDWSSALHDALAQMFPSTAARLLFERFRDGLPEAPRAAQPTAACAMLWHPPVVAKHPLPKDLPDRARIEEALRRNGGNISATARFLGLHRTQLKRLFEKLGMQLGRNDPSLDDADE